MTGFRPGGTPRPFGPSELDGVQGMAPEDLAGATRVARDLEALAGRTPVTASTAFADRVMDAVAAEPSPVPARLAGRSLRRGSIGGFLGSLRDAWRVSVSPGFPMAARAQAMALVLIVAGLVAGSGMATAGALGLLDGNRPSPAPSLQPPSPPATIAPPEASPTPALPTDGSLLPDATETPEPSASPEEGSGAPVGTPEPGETENHGGNRATPEPTETPEPSNDHEDGTPKPTRTPSPTATDHEDGTPQPTQTPHPTETPSDD